MALHHATLKAAVASYAILLTQGKTAEEVKAEIAKDPKEFTSDEVEEIYSAIANPKPEKPKVYKHFVASSFRDIKDFSKEYKVGDEISDLDAERLEGLVSKGLVEKVEQE
ncbi:MAG: hypothetical protein EOO20_12850 [Chryseobacterium sp.]|nr:MAG: hypothetical protein EOO20_12850 [Chryseobacterium sp.]